MIELQFTAKEASFSSIPGFPDPKKLRKETCKQEIKRTVRKVYCNSNIGEYRALGGRRLPSKGGIEPKEASLGLDS